MKRQIWFLLLALILVGCEKDFKFNGTFTPKIVLNSVINPDSTIVVDLYWSQKMGTEEVFDRVVDASVSLYKDGELISVATSGDDAVTFDHYPAAGAEYTLKISLDEYNEVSASTIIPDTPSCDGYRWIDEEPFSMDGHIMSYNVLYEIDKVNSGSNTSSVHVMVRDFKKYDVDDVDYYINSISQNLCGNIPLADQFNMTKDSYANSIANSSDYYYNYIRISEENITKSFPLEFAATRGSRSHSERYPYENDDDTVFMDQWVMLLAVSREYDKYYKSLLMYSEMLYFPTPITFETYSVYSNVKNGLGIFASYNATGHYFEYYE